MTTSAGTTKRTPGAVGIVGDCVLGVILIVALLSRGPRPELAFWPLVIVLSLAACGPPLLLSGRIEAATVGRLATAAAVALLLQLRAPIMVPGLSVTSPRSEPLGLSVHALLMAALAALTLWWRPGDQATATLRRALPWAMGGLVVFCAACFALMDRGLRAMPGGEGMFYAETASALSVMVVFAIVLAYLLTVEDRGRLLRLAVASAAALIVWGLLPAGVGT